MSLRDYKDEIQQVVPPRPGARHRAVEQTSPRAPRRRGKRLLRYLFVAAILAGICVVILAY